MIFMYIHIFFLIGESHITMDYAILRFKIIVIRLDSCFVCLSDFDCATYHKWIDKNDK